MQKGGTLSQLFSVCGVRRKNRLKVQEAVNLRTDNTMAKRKGTVRKPMVNKHCTGNYGLGNTNPTRQCHVGFVLFNR